MLISVDISTGEFLDRLSILELKCRYIGNKKEQYKSQKELNKLLKIRGAIKMRDCKLFAELKKLNRDIWTMKDIIKNNDHVYHLKYKSYKSLFELQNKHSEIISKINSFYKDFKSL